MASYTTPGLSQIAKVARLAINRPNGLHIEFRVGDYDSLAQANAAARSYQSYFANLKAAERKRAFKEAQRMGLSRARTKHADARLQDVHVDPANIIGQFDELSCSKSELPNGRGYLLSMLPSYVNTLGGRVIDPETNEPVREFTKEAKLSSQALMTLMARAQEAKDLGKELVNPLPRDLEDAWFLYDSASAASWYANYGLEIPSVRFTSRASSSDALVLRTPHDTPIQDYDPLVVPEDEMWNKPAFGDPNDTPMDEDPFTFGLDKKQD